MHIGFDAKRLFHNTTGLGNYSRDLVRILASYFPDNQYFLMNPKKPKINRLEIKDNMKIIEPSGLMDRKLPAVWRSKTMIKDLLKNKVDIYHGLSGELPFGIQHTAVKSVVTIHDLIFLHFPELYKPIDRKIYSTKFKYAAAKSDRIVAISQQTKQDLIRFFKIDPGKIDVIYQGCHEAFKMTYNNPLKQKVKTKYRLPNHFLLNVGTIEARKNALSIVKAINGTGHQLVLVGRQTVYADQIHQYIKANNMQKQVHFLEGLSLQELAILYQLADIFIYPSFYEGFGIPIIEAMFSKTPVITNKKGVFPEAAGPYSYYLEQPENPDEIRQMIAAVYANPDHKRLLKSYRYAQEKFSDKKIAEQYMNLYQNLLDNA